MQPWWVSFWVYADGTDRRTDTGPKHYAFCYRSGRCNKGLFPSTENHKLDHERHLDSVLIDVGRDVLCHVVTFLLRSLTLCCFHTQSTKYYARSKTCKISEGAVRTKRKEKKISNLLIKIGENIPGILCRVGHQCWPYVADLAWMIRAWTSGLSRWKIISWAYTHGRPTLSFEMHSTRTLMSLTILTVSTTKNCPSYPMHGSLEPLDGVHTLNSISIGSDVSAQLMAVTNRHTHAHTDHGTSVTIGRIAMWPNNRRALHVRTSRLLIYR